MERKSVSDIKSLGSENITSEIINGFFGKFDDRFIWALTKNGADEKLFISESAETVTGYGRSELNLFPYKTDGLIYNEDRHIILKLFNEFSEDASRIAVSFTYRILTKNDNVKWVEEQICVKRDESGKAAEFYGMVTDISKFKIEESALLKETENLKSLNLSKDRFISMLSHDLRAPFTSILGFSEILINEPDLSHDERLEYLHYINESSQHQLHLINYLLDWTRLQTGRIKIEPRRLNAQTTVFNCVSSLTGNAIRKDIDIKVNLKNNLFIRADERLISQVITNLLNNAIKFSDEGKTIEISADYFNDDMAEFVVKDEGTGISEENKTKLFQIENMFSVEGTKGEKGTGMGLPLVKEIIEKHNGEIWFYSEPDKGSEFHFTVPYSHNTILLVENEPALLQHYQALLNEEFSNFRTIGVKNGYEALTKISEQFPSLVITDYEMPLMNGIQLVEFLRKEDKNFRIPVIATVTELTDNFMKEYKALGIDTVLQKPVDDKLLIEKLQMILDL